MTLLRRLLLWGMGPFLVAAAGAAAGPAAAQSRWGAVAAAPDGAFASAVDLPTRAAAIEAAMSRCGAKCSRSFTFGDGCGAYAQGEAAFGWASAGGREDAIANAMGECRKRTTGCRLRVWLCTTPQ